MPTKTTTRTAGLEALLQEMLDRDSYHSVMYHATLQAIDRTRVAYHGTAADPDAIRRDGLLPRASPGCDAWAVAQGHTDIAHGANRARVYVGQDPVYATYFATCAANAPGRSAGAKRWIVKIALPDAAEKLGAMPDDRCSTAVTFDRVPPEWIVDIREPTAAEARKALRIYGDIRADPAIAFNH